MRINKHAVAKGDMGFLIVPLGYDSLLEVKLPVEPTTEVIGSQIV